MEPLITANQVAERLGVSLSWVRTNTRAGLIPYVAMGGGKRYRPEDIDKFVEDNLKGGK